MSVPRLEPATRSRSQVCLVTLHMAELNSVQATPKPPGTPPLGPLSAAHSPFPKSTPPPLANKALSQSTVPVGIKLNCLSQHTTELTSSHVRKTDTQRMLRNNACRSNPPLPHLSTTNMCAFVSVSRVAMHVEYSPVIHNKNDHLARLPHPPTHTPPLLHKTAPPPQTLSAPAAVCHC